MSLTDSQIQDRIYGEIVTGGMSIDGLEYSFSSIEGVKSWVAKNGDIPQEAIINFRNATYTEVELMYKGLNDPNKPPVLAKTQTVNGKVVETNKPQVKNEKDKPLRNDPTITILASGNAANSATGLRKSNDTRSHVCNMPMYVRQAIYKAGAMGGQIILAIRSAIKALMEALGINPSGSGIISFLKKIAGYIKDINKFMKDITKFVNGLVVYANMIKQLIQYILSLPQRLISFFMKCLQEAYRELKKGYLDILAGTTDKTDSVISEATKVLKETTTLIKTSETLVAATGTLATSLTTLSTTNVTGPAANTQEINDSITAVYAAAGYSGNSKDNYGKA